MNITREHFISRSEREKKNGHLGMVFWFCGLSGSGKSTIARAFEKVLFEQNKQVYILDGDNVRHGLNSDLSFSLEDRDENLRRLAYLADLFSDAGMIVLVSAISPLKKHRDFARSVVRAKFFDVYVSTPLDICEERDVKGLYKKARRGKISDMTGISSPFETPTHPDISMQSIDEISKLTSHIS
mgnify:CR=1 FL=1